MIDKSSKREASLIVWRMATISVAIMTDRAGEICPRSSSAVVSQAGDSSTFCPVCYRPCRQEYELVPREGMDSTLVTLRSDSRKGDLREKFKV